MRIIKGPAGNDLVGLLSVHTGQILQLIFGSLVQIERFVTTPALPDALRHGLGILLHFGGCIRSLFPNLLRTLVPGTPHAARHQPRRDDRPPSNNNDVLHIPWMLCSERSCLR